MKKLDLKNGTVELPHGGGGRAMNQLIDEIFAAAFSNSYLDQGNDQAILEAQVLLSLRYFSPAATLAH